ncbi:MAG: DNA repair protein RadA/Sms [Acidimicrobiales bacterium]|jgi:DNA repair protein RadA/Sms
MAKAKRVFVCTACGAEAVAWTGRCLSCEGWATVEEHSVEQARTVVDRPELQPLLSFAGGGSVPIPTGLDEVDHVLGGGLVAGSVTLLSGEPGIGKSTLTLQLAMSVAGTGSSVVLVTGEEAPVQVAARAGRLGQAPDTLTVFDNTQAEAVIDLMAADQPQLVIVDSIQTVRSTTLDAAPGSVSQVRETANLITAAAKKNEVSVILVGHVTKEGNLAGPRLLEHVVDTVLAFAGDRSSDLRFLRSGKHRFGPTSNVGLFEMTAEGLQPVADPSQRFLADRAQHASGSVVAPILDGHRPVLVEVQALVAGRRDTPAHVAAEGLSTGRLKLVTAVLEQRAGQSFIGQDVFASVAGGIRTDDPGVDLALALALWSSATDVSLGPDLVACGEIGLAGELRTPLQLERRLHEAFRLGFRRAVVPDSVQVAPTGLDLIRCSTVRQAIEAVAATTPVASSNGLG